MQFHWAFLAACVLSISALSNSAAQPASREQTLTRPVDLAYWPSLGSTMRTDGAPAAMPRQLRQVQMETSAYRRLVETLRLSDGDTFAVLFYGVEHDTTHTPSLYFAQREQALAMEVIDRAHPDGRRFYVFSAGQTSASPLSPGNECAVCHAARGTFDGTFAHMYPVLAALNLPAQGSR